MTGRHTSLFILGTLSLTLLVIGVATYLTWGDHNGLVDGNHTNLAGSSLPETTPISGPEVAKRQVEQQETLNPAKAAARMRRLYRTPAEHQIYTYKLKDWALVHTTYAKRHLAPTTLATRLCQDFLAGWLAKLNASGYGLRADASSVETGMNKAEQALLTAWSAACAPNGYLSNKPDDVADVMDTTLRYERQLDQLVRRYEHGDLDPADHPALRAVVAIEDHLLEQMQGLSETTLRAYASVDILDSFSSLIECYLIEQEDLDDETRRAVHRHVVTMNQVYAEAVNEWEGAAGRVVFESEFQRALFALFEALNNNPRSPMEMIGQSDWDLTDEQRALYAYLRNSATENERRLYRDLVAELP